MPHLSTLCFRLPMLTSRWATCGIEITSRCVSGSPQDYRPGRIRISMPARPRGTDILIGRLCFSTSATQLQRITCSMTLSLSWLWKRMGLHHSEHIPGAPRPAATGPRPRRRWTQRAAPRAGHTAPCAWRWTHRASRWTRRALRVALDTTRLALDTPRLALDTPRQPGERRVARSHSMCTANVQKSARPLSTAAGKK